MEKILLISLLSPNSTHRDIFIDFDEQIVSIPEEENEYIEIKINDVPIKF